MEGFVERAGPRPERQEHTVNPERVSQGRGQNLPSGQIQNRTRPAGGQNPAPLGFQSFSSPMFFL